MTDYKLLQKHYFCGTMFAMETEVLKKYPIFAGVSDGNLLRFVERYPIVAKTYSKDTLLFMHDTVCSTLMLLDEGVVRIQLVNSDGRQVTIEELDAPRILAPAALFSTDGLFPVNIVALTDCKILHINKQHFLELLHDDPVVMLNYIKLLSDKSKFLSHKIGSFALQNLKSRFAAYLLAHKEQRSQQEIADELGVARQSLARVLAELIDDGAVKMEGRRIVIVDSDMMKSFGKL